MDLHPPSVASIERAIGGYLQRHPHAVDTERGILEWWLQGCRPRPPEAVVHAAIEALLARGELMAIDLHDGQVAYAAGRAATLQPLDCP